jgi:translation initiation factor 2 subunit 1
MRSNLLPSVNDITMVVPVKITDLGVYVQLLEFNNIEGLIILSDLCKSRYKSINKVVSIGKNFAASVQTIDLNTNNITLSKKNVSEEESKKCESNYKILKTIRDIVMMLIKKLEKDHNIKVDIPIIYDNFIWCISTNPEFVLFALKSASKDFDKIYEKKLQNIDEIWINTFKEILSMKFNDGINIIKQSLLKGCSMATTEFPFKIKLVKSPYYSITIKTNKQDNAIQLINDVIESIKNELVQNGANFKIKKLPEIILDKEFEPDNSDDEDSNDEDSENDTDE